MCHFFSCIVRKDGEILWEPTIDSHEDLVGLFELKDETLLRRNWVRLEFLPRDSKDVFDPQTWIFKVDEEETLPDWFSEEFVLKTRASLEKIVSKFFIVDKEVNLCIHQNLVLKNAKVENLNHCYVYSMHASSRIEHMYDSSRVNVMHDSSKIGNMYDSSEVNVIYDSSSINTMRDSSSINTMCDSSSVVNMYGSSYIGYMYGSSYIGYMYGSSKIGNMYDSSKMLNDQRQKGEKHE